ncbi:MAG: EamA/RhaT family transporter [Shimia sp.]
MIWVPVTLFAAFAQTTRFVLQKHLADTQLSPGGATLARFLFAFPILFAGVWIYASLRGLTAPVLTPGFWAFAATGGVAQILATMCTVALFKHRHFAVGVTFAKTEVLQAALLGVVLLGEAVSGPALIAILVGLPGVLTLSDHAATRPGARVLNRATGLGLAAGLLFGLSGVAYRGAILGMEGADAVLRPALALAIVTLGQTLVLGAWLRLREPGQITRILSAWRLTGLVALTSLAGSLGWFIAFGLQNAAYVKALGQVELVFSVLAGALIFRERITPREGGAMILIAVSAVGIILFT